MSCRLQARAKRNAIVHAASGAPCSRHRELINRPTCRLHVHRRAGGPIARVAGDPCHRRRCKGVVDTTLPSNASAFYRIRAVNGGTPSAPTVADVATTVIFADDPMQAEVTRSRATHIVELRTAVNALRLLAGIGSAAFTDPALSSSSPVRRLHLTELRTALDAARAALNLPALVYADPVLTENTRVRAVHVTDIRGGVK
jgi:hypothetical protein